jgi:hypothetical protein
VILTQKTESQLVAYGFANTAGAREQKLFDGYSVNHSSRMGIAPRRITTTGFETGYINCVLNSKAQPIQRATTRQR